MTGPTIELRERNMAVITWTSDPDDAPGGFRILRANMEGNINEVALLSGGRPELRTRKHVHIDGPLLPGIYTYRIAAINAQGNERALTDEGLTLIVPRHEEQWQPNWIHRHERAIGIVLGLITLLAFYLASR